MRLDREPLPQVRRESLRHSDLLRTAGRSVPSYRQERSGAAGLWGGRAGMEQNGGGDEECSECTGTCSPGEVSYS